jgi:hypothetical protein
MVVVVGILSTSLAGMAKAGSIPTNGCWCLDDSLHCYNMRRDVSGWWGELGANHTFTKCEDRYGNTSVWEDNWASPDYSQNNLGSAWVEEDMGCIKLDSLFAAEAETNQGFANACTGYAACAGDNSGSECQSSYFPLDACYCFPWQLGFRSRLQHSYVIECPVQGGGSGGGGSSDPSEYDYGPYYADNGPWYEDDGTSLWRVCMDYCSATIGSAIYSNGEYIGGSVSCVEWNTECWLEWYYN